MTATRTNGPLLRSKRVNSTGEEKLGEQRFLADRIQGLDVDEVDRRLQRWVDADTQGTIGHLVTGTQDRVTLQQLSGRLLDPAHLHVCGDPESQNAT